EDGDVVALLGQLVREPAVAEVQHRGQPVADHPLGGACCGDDVHPPRLPPGTTGARTRAGYAACVSDPFIAAASLEGVPSAFRAARDGMDAILRDRGLRRSTPDDTARSLLIG